MKSYKQTLRDCLILEYFFLVFALLFKFHIHLTLRLRKGNTNVKENLKGIYVDSYTNNFLGSSKECWVFEKNLEQVS